MEPPTTTGTCQIPWVIGGTEHVCGLRLTGHPEDVHYCAEHFGCWPMERSVVVPDGMGWWLGDE